MSQREFNYLLFQLCQSGLGEKLPELLYIFKNELPDDCSQSIHGISDLFNELERRCVFHVHDVEPLKEALQLVQRQDLADRFAEFERKRDRQGGLLERFAVNIHCNFRTISSGVLVVGAVVILRKCSTLPEFMDAFEKVILPAANKLCAISEGSVCFTVQAENLSALQVLWQQYQDGTLQKKLQDFLITEEINQLADGQEVMVNVDIDEQEYKAACLDLMIAATEAFELSKENEHSRQRRRSNSDSSIFCQSKEDNEMLLKRIEANLPEWENKQNYFEVEAEFVEGERSDFVRRYLEKLQETNSVTTDTTDSGLGNPSAPSVFGIEEESDFGNGLRCKDLNENITDELSRRLQSDKVAWRNVCEAFDLKGLSRDPSAFKDVIKLFPDTPVRLFRELFEALEMYDLVELLEKAKPIHSSLRFRRSLEEARTLRQGENRPTTYHSTAAVLIIDGHENTVSTEKIRKFFVELSLDSDVTIIRVDKYILTKLHGSVTSRPIERKFLERRKLRELREMEMREEEQREREERELKELREKEKVKVELREREAIELGRKGGERMELSEKEKVEAEVRGREEREEKAIELDSEGGEREIKELGEKEKVKVELKDGEKWKREVMEVSRKGQEKELRYLVKGDRELNEKEEKETTEPKGASEREQKQKELSGREMSESKVSEREQKQRELRELRNVRDRELRELKETDRRETDMVKTATCETLNRWIHNQDKFSFFAVFDFTNLSSARRAVLEEPLLEKLKTLSNQPKFVMSSSNWTSLGQFPETLHVTYSYPSEDLATSVHEILNKRWQSLDVSSMMEELHRTFGATRRNVKLEVRDKLSSLLKLEKN